jgi:hypothetical protein
LKKTQTAASAACNKEKINGSLDAYRNEFPNGRLTRSTKGHGTQPFHPAAAW